MSAKAAEHIVAFLSFAPETADRLNALSRLSDRSWRRVLQWLDDAGLALYFFSKLNETNATKHVPGWVLSKLQARFALNQLRVKRMTERFDLLNRQFAEAGIRYIALKGLSLVPEFCPSAELRYQGDFDFLIDEGSLRHAKQILIELGYSPKVSRSSRELIYLSSTAEPSRNSSQYDSRSLHAVELHLDVWDDAMHEVTIPKLFSVERAVIHQTEGSVFPVLCDADAFLLQVIHALRHIFTQWLRMSCLLEIAYFLNRRASDIELWNDVEHRIGKNAVLREFVVVVVELASQLFAAPVPDLIIMWGRSIRRGPRVWIDNYACDWAFCDLPVYQFNLFPASKLMLFLYKEYRDTSQDVRANGTPPASGVARIVQAIKDNPAIVFQPKWWKRKMFIRRSLYHALATLRYAAEIPRWRWRNRVQRNLQEGQVLQQHSRGDFAEF